MCITLQLLYLHRYFIYIILIYYQGNLEYLPRFLNIEVKKANYVTTISFMKSHNEKMCIILYGV